MNKNTTSVNQSIHESTVKRLVCLGLFLLVLVSWMGRQPATVTAEPTGSAGTIAYVRNGTIRLIEPDGSQDRLLWSAPTPGPYGVMELDWNPAASELAFASDHEAACSVLEADIYGIRPDGSGLRRITNAPICAALDGYPKGSVTVTVENDNLGSGPFHVYVQGAPGAQMVSIPFGGQTTVTFPEVADFGDTLQQAVVSQGIARWVAPLTLVDVLPGQTVHAGTLRVVGNGIQNYGAHAPSWHSQGTRLGYVFGGCVGLAHLPAQPPPGYSGEFLLNVQESGCVMDWAPPQLPAQANEILYWSFGGGGIYRVMEGSSQPGDLLVNTTTTGQWVWDVFWLPDGSGFLYSFTPWIYESGNIYHYDFATGQSTQLTHFTDRFTREFSLSPDGQQIVFELATAWDSSTADLWTMRLDGTALQLLVANGRHPAWSGQALQAPSKAYLPAVLR